MYKILDYIQNVPDKKVAFISENKEITFAHIVDLYRKNRTILESIKDSCVVIKAKDKLEFGLLLSLLDGHVKRILFLPNDIDAELSKDFYRQTVVDLEVSLEDDCLKIIEINSENKSLNNTQTEWILATSGTTNTPKLVTHSLESLSKTVIINRNKSDEYIWGLTFDIYRFSGIQVFLQAVLSQNKLIIPNSHEIKDIINLFVEKKCNVVSATPSFWRKVLMIQESKQLRLKRATLGGEIADEALLGALKKAFLNIKITHIYASTEAGVGFGVHDEKAGFPKEYLDNKSLHIKMKIDDMSRLFIKPLNQSQNYLNKESMYDEQGYINTGDLVKVTQDRVYFLGRESGSINVGGNKVMPEEIEEKLLKSRLISAVHVYAKKSPIVGFLVCADIVAMDKQGDQKILKTKVLNYCKEHLQKYQIPALIRVIDELEINLSGKIKRNSTWM